ncbi:alpha/beta-hydrolase family protein [Janibacter anophelis]
MAVLGAAAPVQPAGAAPEAAVLTQDSPFGAVRAHAGIRDGESVRARAARAADELVAEGGLTREHVVVVVPTGSGWVNPNLVAGLEERFGDEVATVAVQYDTAPSWWAYLAHREQAEEGAREAVTAVLARVRTLPEDERPQVHVVSESLGATAGQTVFTDEVRRQVCSALWVGSPGGQVAGLPREASVANEDDPVVHSSLQDLVVPRDDGRWVPAVGAVHGAADFLGSLEVPDGAGHRYGPDIADALPPCD